MARQEFDYLGASQSLFNIASRIKGEELAQAKHEAAMKRYTQDWEGTKLTLQLKRQEIDKNKRESLQAQRTAAQTKILDSKTSASQVIALGRQAIKDIQDSTGNNTEYTKDQQLDIKEARSQISIGNNLLADALTREVSFNKPQTPPQQLAMLKQKFYSGLDRQSANINVSPLNQSNQNEISRIDALVKPDRRAAWVQAQSSGSMATIRGFGADQNNVYNPTQQANARAAITALLSVQKQVTQFGDDEAQRVWTEGLLNSLGKITEKVDLEARIKTKGWDALQIRPAEKKPQPDRSVDAVTGGAQKQRTDRPVQIEQTSKPPTFGPLLPQGPSRGSIFQTPQSPRSQALEAAAPTSPAQDLKSLSNDELFQRLLNSRIKK